MLEAEIENEQLTQKMFSCNTCEKKCNTKWNLKQHELSHTVIEKPFFCEYCDKKFVLSSQKNVHERIHTGEKPFQCHHCDKKFVTKASKDSHERVHTGEKPYQCQFCDKKFGEQRTKDVHERIHSGDKPFSCKFCASAFRHQGSLIGKAIPAVEFSREGYKFKKNFGYRSTIVQWNLWILRIGVVSIFQKLGIILEFRILESYLKIGY